MCLGPDGAQGVQGSSTVANAAERATGTQVQERAMVKRGCYDPDDVGQYRSAAPSIQWGLDDRQEDGVTFAVPKG